jgi:hypothetical protein
MSTRGENRSSSGVHAGLAVVAQHRREGRTHEAPGRRDDPREGGGQVRTDWYTAFIQREHLESFALK